MNIRNQVRILALGAMLTLSVAGLPAVQAHAQPRQGGGTGMSCTNPETGGTVNDGDTTEAFGLTWECHDGVLTIQTDIPLHTVGQGTSHPVHVIPVAPATGLAVAP